MSTAVRATYPALLAALRDAADRARQEDEPEAAIRHLTFTARAVLGDPAAAERPGALKPGETAFGVSGFFAVAPTGDHLVLLADYDFPPSQRFLRISITDSRPGFVVTNDQPVVLPNTDDDTLFRQILSTARMGSALYAPVRWGERVLGMFNVACQARNTYGPADLQMLMVFADLLANCWMAKGGPTYLERVCASLPPWEQRAAG